MHILPTSGPRYMLEQWPKVARSLSTLDITAAPCYTHHYRSPSSAYTNPCPVPSVLSLFMQQTKWWSNHSAAHWFHHTALNTKLFVLQPRNHSPYRDDPSTHIKIWIAFGTAHPIIVLKLLPKFQVLPIFFLFSYDRLCGRRWIIVQAPHLELTHGGSERVPLYLRS